MPLNLASRTQVSGHFFLRRRIAHGLLRRSVRMLIERERWQKLGLILSAVLGVLVLIGAFVLSWLRPAGLVGTSKIVANNRTGEMWVQVDGRLHPVLNLVSARLIAANPEDPVFVSPAEIDKYPKGPTVGIKGAPTATPRVLAPDMSRWSVCDSTSTTLAGLPAVTGIDGELTLGAGAQVLGQGQAAVLLFGQQAFVVAGGVRMPVDLADRAVTGPLGIVPGHPVPVMSRALFDALPAGGPLIVPTVPDAGAPSPVALGVPLVNGAVVVTQDVATAEDRFYVVSGDGVQPISSVVAAMLRQRDSFGFANPPRVTPDRLAKVPVRHVLNVDHYPAGPLTVVDSRDRPVTCVAWERGTQERQARLSVISARELPITAAQFVGRIPLVGGGDRGVQADQVVITDGAVTFISTTGSAQDSPARQTMWLLDATGTRFGVPYDEKALQALGLNLADTRLAPWSMLQVWPQGPELSQVTARAVHGATPGAVAVLPGAAGVNQEGQ
ncbi:type VII secretion protein EccB [Mycobacteroides abscessus]|uniref:type VII secretion protein EccB n=1 Tax=Mycobacteroides abscessus TaxID=36809 RepID=UPI0004CEC383|nr:type VII secretion protein EccB [Mycobacteroides abscessus]MDO3268004.1 type VII secretion protein EccB [Mycobacteroides abscessus subsp. abscessus]